VSSNSILLFRSENSAIHFLLRFTNCPRVAVFLQLYTNGLLLTISCFLSIWDSFTVSSFSSDTCLPMGPTPYLLWKWKRVVSMLIWNRQLYVWLKSQMINFGIARDSLHHSHEDMFEEAWNIAFIKPGHSKGWLLHLFQIPFLRLWHLFVWCFSLYENLFTSHRFFDVS